MSFIIDRAEGQDIGSPPATPRPPWELPGDTGQAHSENVMIFEMEPPVSGAHRQHLDVHLSFLESPLGQALPKKIRQRMVDHVLGHLAEVLRIPDEGSVESTPMEKAAKIASLQRDYYANGTG